MIDLEHIASVEKLLLLPGDILILTSRARAI